jgi:hypothetical protein
MIKKTLFILILIAYPLSAQFIQHSSIQALDYYICQEKHAPQDVLVIFDLDNTLIQPVTEIGSDQWLEYAAKKEAQEKNITLAQAYKNLLPLYFKVQDLIDLQLVEELATDLISKMQSAGIRVIGLTMRSHPIIERTISQLNRLNISFSSLNPHQVILEGFAKDPIYKDGIIFCSSNDKGVILFEFLHRFAIKPKKIFCFDDKHHHLEKVHAAAVKNNVECMCIHYIGCNERVEKFDHVQAEQELLALNIG